MNLTLPDHLDIIEQGAITIPSSDFYVVTTEHLFRAYGHLIEPHVTKTLFIRDNSVDDLNCALASLPSRKLYYRAEDYPLLVAFGGGRVIDSTKYLAHVLQVPYVSVPTTLSNDGICSPGAVLKNAEGYVRFRASSPKSVMVPLEVIRQAPIETIRAGVGDLLGNISALQDWDLAHKIKNEPINRFAYALSKLSCADVLNYFTPDSWSEDDWYNLLTSPFLYRLAQALLVSGIAMEIAGSSRPCSGAEHLFSHALDKLLPQNTIPHGYKVAFGTVLMEALRWPEAYPITRSYFESAKLPVTCGGLGVAEDLVVEALLLAPSINPTRYTILHDRTLTRDGMVELVRRVG